MKILITGIAGFLGSHLADKLLADGHEVYGIDNLVGGYESNVPAGVTKWWRFDTSDVSSCFEVLSVYKIEAIYHCACTAYEGLSVFSPAFIVQNTLQNTVGILSASIQAGVKRFIFCSSMARYGNGVTPFEEFQETQPVDPYGVAKVASERIIEMLAETHGFEYVIAVPHNIYGERQLYTDPYRNVASIMINRMLQGNPPIIYGDGEQKRSFSYVGDCVDILAKMISCPPGSIWNIGPDEIDGTILTINELYHIIANLIGFNGAPIYMPDRPREVKNAWCSSSKIRKEFGFTSSVNIEDGLTKLIHWIKQKGPAPFQYDRIPVEIKRAAPKTWTDRLL